MDDDEYMVTTIDNPYNYYTHFDQWYAYDTGAGHFTLNFLARVARTSNDLSDEDNAQAVAQAVDDIVRENVSGIYTKVKAPQLVT